MFQQCSDFDINGLQVFLVLQTIQYTAGKQAGKWLFMENNLFYDNLNSQGRYRYKIEKAKSVAAQLLYRPALIFSRLDFTSVLTSDWLKQ